MIKLVADTNIYISALVFGGKPREVLELAETGQIKLFISTTILDETLSRLEKKFLWSKNELVAARQKMLKMSVLVQPQEKLFGCVDPDDNKILECAAEARADYIVSGDNHLLLLKQFRQIKILRPAKFLQGELWK